MTEISSSDSPELDALSAVNPVDVRLAAMNLLARREHSLRELRQKLRRRFDDETVLEEELLRLARENLQSDERFAESYVRQRSGRGYGPQRVRQEMRGKGLSDDDIARAFEVAEVDWYELAGEVYRKKFGGTGDIDLREKARRQRFMQYRGFSGDHYGHLLDE